LGRIRLPRQHVNPERQWPLAYLWQPRPLAIGKTYCQRRAVRTWRKADTFGRGDFGFGIKSRPWGNDRFWRNADIRQTGDVRQPGVVASVE
jgi:hypothetical protein